jgi:hypothetical protein
MHYQDRKADLCPLDLVEIPEMPWKGYPEHFLPPQQIPANGHLWIKRDQLIAKDQCRELNMDNGIENSHFLIQVDSQRGGLPSLIQKKTGKEWVDSSAPWRLNEWVEERLIPSGEKWARDDIFHMDYGAPSIENPNGWNRDWQANRKPAQALLDTQLIESPIGLHLIQWFSSNGSNRDLRQEVFLPNYAEWIEFKSRWLMQEDPHPRAHYCVFPFLLPEAQARVDIGGVAIRPELDQLPGCCHDYFTAQQWVDLSNLEQGVTIAVPENPMVQFGGCRFGEAAKDFDLKRPWFMGWGDANFWHCNFPSTQSGWLKNRYRLQFHDAFNLQDTDRFAKEAMQEHPLIHSITRPRLPGIDSVHCG